MQHLVLYVCIAIFMILHVPAGACILVVSVSPIHVFPIQPVLKLSIVVLTNIVYIYMYIHAKTTLGYCSWWASPTRWGVKISRGVIY